MESPLYDYYPHYFHQLYQHNFFEHTIKQEPRYYDPLFFAHPNPTSPYQALLSPLHTEISISQQSRQSTYYSQSMRSPILPQQQQPAYHLQTYSGGSVHPTELIPATALASYPDQLGCDPRFVTTLQQDVDLDEMSAMILPSDVVEDTTIGDEDAEGEEDWSGSDHQPWVHSTSVPIPVPNLTKKSRGRRVPTMSSLEDLRSAASGAGRKRQGMGGKSARMYLCEVKGCGKCFARGEHLKRHVRSIHTHEKREVLSLL